MRCLLLCALLCVRAWSLSWTMLPPVIQTNWTRPMLNATARLRAICVPEHLEWEVQQVRTELVGGRVVYTVLDTFTIQALPRLFVRVRPRWKAEASVCTTETTVSVDGPRMEGGYYVLTSPTTVTIRG